MHTKLLITRREAGLMLTSLAVAATVPAQATQGMEPVFYPSLDLRALQVEASLDAEATSKTAIWSLENKAAPLTSGGGKPSPVFYALVGKECVVSVQNDTDLSLSLHWHGARTIPNLMDGVGGLTQDPIPPRGNFTYRFTPQEPGTWLIRPCVIGGTSEPAGRGLRGMMVVLDKPSFGQITPVPVMVSDWLLDHNKQQQPFTRTTRGRLGNLLTVNGRPCPAACGAEIQKGMAPPMRLRLWLANACNARSFRIRFDNMKAYVMAVDGQPTEAFEPLKSSLPFSPGTRYDVIVDLPGDGTTAAVTALIGQGLPLMTFAPVQGSTGAAWNEPPSPPIANPLLPQKIRLQDALRFDISLDAIFGKPAPGKKTDEHAPTVWAFNGLADDIRKEKPLFSVKSGRPVVLALNNTTSLPQPIHVHGHSFRLLHPFDDGWDPFWLDTILIPAKSTVRIAFIAGAPGKWLVASTVCEHFDTGLWGWFEVV